MATGGLLGSVVRFAVRFRGVVVALAVLLVAYGAFVLSEARYDVFPEFAPPQVVIQTEAAGLAPEQVEMLVTQPLENALNGAAGVESLRSTSIEGLSVVTIVFDPESDIVRDRQVVAERLAEVAAQLPTGVKTPALAPLTSSTSTVLIVGFTSQARSLMELRTLADWTLRAGRRQGRGVRRRGAPAPGAGAPGAARALRLRPGGRAGSRAALDGHARRRLHRDA
jgi:Cu/Ag efflux pump CusA